MPVITEDVSAIMEDVCAFTEDVSAIMEDVPVKSSTNFTKSDVADEWGLRSEQKAAKHRKQSTLSHEPPWFKQDNNNRTILTPR